MKQGYLRLLQVLGSLVLAFAITALDSALFRSLHAVAPDSLLFKIMEYIAFFLLIPGGIVAWLVGGGAHDLDMKLAQTINVVIYTGLGYVFFRFLEWRRGPRRSR